MSDKWEELRRWTQARIGLGRSGHSLPTRAWLEFQHARARARDAIHRPWDAPGLKKALERAGDKSLVLHTEVDSSDHYLQRPDLGRKLRTEDFEALARGAQLGADLVFCVSDGLSSMAIDTHFLPLWNVFRARLSQSRFTLHPLVLVPFGRVAVSDAIGEALNAKCAVIFIGERPGLSAADSLGMYLTYAPKRGTPDARRNCLSNIRPPQGLSYELAARKLLYLIEESLRRQLSGVELKEEAALMGSC